jgi:hypothetical protein
MNLGELKSSLAQIGSGHDSKPVAVICDGRVVYLEACIALQGDRVLIDATTKKPPCPRCGLLNDHRYPCTS